METEEELTTVMSDFFKRSVKSREGVTGVPPPFHVPVETQMFETKPLVVDSPPQQTNTPTERSLPPKPTVTSVTPNTGSESGGTNVAIVGTGFLRVARVKFGGTLEGPGGTFTDPQHINAVTPAHTPGIVDVDVINLGNPPNELKGTLVRGFTFGANPTISAIAANYGDTLGGNSVTITGANFVSGITAKVGGVPLTGVSFINSTRITGITGAHAPGTVDVTVKNPDNDTEGTLPNGFYYEVAPFKFFTDFSNFGDPALWPVMHSGQVTVPVYAWSADFVIDTAFRGFMQWVIIGETGLSAEFVSPVISLVNGVGFVTFGAILAGGPPGTLSVASRDNVFPNVLNYAVTNQMPRWSFITVLT